MHAYETVVQGHLNIKLERRGLIETLFMHIFDRLHHEIQRNTKRKKIQKQS